MPERRPTDDETTDPLSEQDSSERVLAERVLAGDAAVRAEAVRAAVEDRARYVALLPVLARAFGEGDTARRAAAVHVSRALMARPLVAPLLDAWAAEPSRFLGVPDPLRPGSTLAESVFAFVREARARGQVRAEAFLREALAWPELRVEAFYAIGADDGAALLPHLGALLVQRPALAEALGTQYALLHRPLAVAACRALRDAPSETRRAFADALFRHLDRVHAVRLKVDCRRELFGR